MDVNPDSEPGPCPIGQCARIIGGKWTLLVIRDLSEGPRHYGELERSLQGISPRTLADRLRFLVEEGLATRTYIKGLPPRTIYALTEKGEALLPLLGAMREYGSVHLCEDGSRPATTCVAEVDVEPAAQATPRPGSA